MMKNIPITVLFISLFVFSAVALAKSPGMRKEQLVTMEVTGAGFVPAEIKVKAKQPVRLVVTRKTDRTCAKEIVLKEFNINHPLPLNQPTEVKFTPPKPGSYRYACGMDMIAGVLIVE